MVQHEEQTDRMIAYEYFVRARKPILKQLLYFFFPSLMMKDFERQYDGN